MTTLGKILVFVLFLVSLGVSAIISVDWLTRTRWAIGYNNVAAQLVRERESHVNTINRRNQLEAEKNAEVQQIKNEFKTLNDRLVMAENIAKAAELKRQNAENQLAAQNAIIDKLKTMNENREAEVKKIDALLSEAVKKNTDLAKDNKELAEKKVEFEIKTQSLKERNEQLVLQVQNLLKEAERIRLGEAARSQRLVRNPPPEDIKGRIKAADPQSGLVTINLGSDSGLSKGNTLEVYRLAPKPTYLGTLRITDVRPNEAVGRLDGQQRRSTLQVGDEVASEILSRR